MVIKLGILRYLLLLLFIYRSVIGQCCHHSPVQSICPESITAPSDGTCNDWCDVRYNITDSKNGTVDISLGAPCQSLPCYKVKLYVLQSANCSQVGDNDLIEDDPDIVQHVQHGRHRYVHSEDCFSIRINESLKCSKRIRLKFHYLFSGCYRLRLEPREIGGGPSCFSNLFQIQTDYKKYLIPVPSIDLVKVYNNQAEIKNFWYLESPGTRLDYVRTSLIGYNNSYSSYHCEKETGDDKSYLSRNDPCSAPNCDDHPLAKTNESCFCEWSAAGLMRCHFYSLRPGLYRMLVEARDIRCETLSLWRDFGSFFGNQCLWHKDQIVEIKANQTVTSIYASTDLLTLIKHNLNTIIPAVVALIVAVIVAVLVCCKYKRTDRTWYQIVPQFVMHRFHNDMMMSRKVLLLYPRDCPPFMEAMKVFRTILESAGFKVIDPFDPKLYEDVATCSNTWGLKYLSDPTVKVILAASWCSLKLEEGILVSKPLVHTDRRPFDTVFTTLLNQLYLEDLPYKKIYVVRLDCDKVGDLRYKHIASCRNFTLPQCSLSLIHQLLELPADTAVKIEDEQLQIRKLDDAIRQYNSYLRDNPDYLTTFLARQPHFINNMIELKTFNSDEKG